MQTFNDVVEYIPYILPIALIQFGLMIYAILDLAKRERTKGPKWLWVLVILFGQLIGPIVYLLIGQEEA